MVMGLTVRAVFYVDGTTIPEVDWNIGPGWAGLLPISDDKGETRKVNATFYFFPPGPMRHALTMWTNGGPGWSSLGGLLQENGVHNPAPDSKFTAVLKVYRLPMVKLCPFAVGMY